MPLAKGSTGRTAIRPTARCLSPLDASAHVARPLAACWWLLEPHQRGAEMRFGRIPVRVNGGMAAEQPLHRRALDALATPVDQPNHFEPGLLCRLQIFIDDGLHIARMERMEIDGVFDREADRVVHQDQGSGIGDRGSVLSGINGYEKRISSVSA